MHQKQLKNFINEPYLFKFRGTLKDIDLSTLDINKIKMLVDKGIFVKMNFNFFDCKLQQFSSAKFEIMICYKGESYEINPIIIAEIFCHLKEIVEYCDEKVEYFLEDLFYEVNKIIGKKRKKKYLIKQYKKNFPDDEDFKLYSTLINDDDILFGNYIGWYEHIYDYLSDDAGVILIKSYLEQSDSNSDFYDLLKSVIEIDKMTYHDELEDVLNKWHYFYEKEEILKDLLWKIEQLKESKADETKYDKRIKENEDSSGTKLSALEAAYYVYYMREAKEKIVEGKEHTVAKFFGEIGNRFHCNSKNIEKEHGKILRDKDYRLKSSTQRKNKLEKILPILTEQAKIQCEIDLNFIKQNL